MGRLNYSVGRFFARWIYALGIRDEIVRPKVAERPGGYLLACTHLSHLEPFVLSAIVGRKIDWMARLEFYRWRPFAWLMSAVDCFPVNRSGVPVRSIRTAIARGRAGRIVGIFPEGGVVTGPDAAGRGGPFKRGVCLIAMRADVPIVPCVILGTHTLNQFYPWVPFGRAKLWIAFGQPIFPPLDAPTRRIGREIMARQLSNAYCALYKELLDRYGISDGSIP
jgi:1-acyl-sn-glycerol-3-phosphate acyltransferase